MFVDELFPGYIPASEALTVRTDPAGGQITVLALELVGGSSRDAARGPARKIGKMKVALCRYGKK